MTVWGPPPDLTSKELPSKNILVVLTLHKNVVAHETLVVELITLIILVRNDRSCEQLMARQSKRPAGGWRLAQGH